MRYKVSFAVFIYAVTAVIDAALGIGTLNPTESYLFRFAAAASIMATFLYLISKDKPLRPLLFILASLALSIITLAEGRRDPAAVINVPLKISAAILTLKPEIIEVEIITEEEEGVNTQP